MTPSEYKDHKALKRESSRDHMTNLELIFTMLGEEGTKQKAVDIDAQGFDENKFTAEEGGTAAGAALEAFREKTGKKIVSEQNFKQQIAAAKKDKQLKTGEKE